MPSSTKKSAPTPTHRWPRIAISILVVVSLLFIVTLIFRFPSNTDNTQRRLSPISEDINQDSPLFSRVGLTTLDSCEAVLNYYKENALEKVTAWGLGDGRYGYLTSDLILESADSITTQDSVTSSPTSSQPASHSTTNIQVAGVDEADIVKTDGKYIYALSGQTIQIVDVHQKSKDNPPNILAEFDLDFYAIDMLISLKPESQADSSDTLVIVGRSQDHYQLLRLAQIDIDDRQNPTLIADFSIDGEYTGMRLVGNTVRLVTTSVPLGFDWESPAGSGLRAQEKALEANKEIIRNSELNNWVPAYKDNLQAGFETDSFIDCSQLLVPNVFSGLDTLSITTFDASKQLTSGSWQAVGLAAGGQEIYATTEHVYVATTEAIDETITQDTAEEIIIEPPIEPPAGLKTIIHKFGLAADSQDEQETTNSSFTPRPIYMASGQVTGSILNQFSMDEYEGDLRVAVNVNDFSGDTVQENHVRILRPNQGILEEIGSITGLGVDERIYAVRFMGPQAYVVTFRQIDPLYALDLSDPTNPRALGELKITGFSSYLHPVGENLLLGVGQEANEEGRTEGLQLSLFDTSDSNKPQRISQLLLNDILQLDEIDNLDHEYIWSSSQVENDHRAFLFYEDLSFVPYTIRWSLRDSWRQERQAGILVVEVKDGTLSVKNILKALDQKEGKSTDKEIYFEPIRTIVIDDVVYGMTWDNDFIAWQMPSGQLLHVITD